MDIVLSEDVKKQCWNALENIGATNEVCQFFAEVLQCEYDMTHATYRMQKDLSDEFSKRPVNTAALFAIMQCLSKRFYQWKNRVASLSERQNSIPPLQCNIDKLSAAQNLKALCSLETIDMNMYEGDDLIVTDATCPNRLKVRNTRGEEGYVPALCCLLPTPDFNANNAVERLEVHLLTSWTESARKVKSLFFDHISYICNCVANTLNRIYHGLAVIRERDRVRRRMKRVNDAASVRKSVGLDLSKLHHSLFSLERELASLTSADFTDVIKDVANIDKAVLCCQNFYKQYRSYRDSLKEAPRPIRIVQRLEHLRQLAHGKNFKYYELKMTLEDVETKEEITHLPSERRATSRSWLRSVDRLSSSSSDAVEPLSPQSTILPGGLTAKHEAVATEQLTTSSCEERQRFVIKAVRDPRSDKQLSLQDAVSAGIMVPARGVYRNPATGDEMPIATAMNSGQIIIDFTTKTRSVEKTKAIGLITIRTVIDNREFTVTGALDSLTARRIDADEARARGIIVDGGRTGPVSPVRLRSPTRSLRSPASPGSSRGQPVFDEDNADYDYYLVEATGQRIPLLQAIESGWVFVEYEVDEEHAQPEVEVHTYAVSDVKDPLIGSDMPFVDAVRRGIIDRDTGDYVNRHAGERIPISDAIQRGLVGARLLADDDELLTLGLDRRDAVVVERIGRLRTNVLTKLRVVNAFKSAANKE